MALHSLENMLGQTGYVKLGRGVYLYGEITEAGRSGQTGYNAILEGFNNGRQIKTSIWGEAGLIPEKIVPKGIILGKR